MATRDKNQWYVFNYAEIGARPEKFNTKMEALQYVLKYSENQVNPFIQINEEAKDIDYRGNVYL